MASAWTSFVGKTEVVMGQEAMSWFLMDLGCQAFLPTALGSYRVILMKSPDELGILAGRATQGSMESNRQQKGAV